MNPICTLVLVAAPALSPSNALPNAIGQQGSPPAAETAQAQAMIQRGELAAAIELLRGRTEAAPEDGLAWYLLGRALHGLGEFDEAVGTYERACEFPGLEASAAYDAGCALARLGEADLALEWLGRATEAGFVDFGRMRTDEDLASVRDDARFRALLPAVGPPAFREDVAVLRAWNGESGGDQFGWIGRNAGDADGDGVADVLLSAPTRNEPGRRSCGKIYLYSGADGALLFERTGSAGESLGIGIDGAGDVNGDGHADVLAGASGSAGNTGAAYVFSGKDGEILLTLRGESRGDLFGRKVAGVGDIDGDGHDDVLVGAPNHDGPGGADSGRAYLLSGKDGSRILALDGTTAGERFGNAVDGSSSSAEKLLVIGAPGAGEGARGRVYVYRYESGSAELAFAIESGPDDVNLGRMFVSAVGDVDGDGVVDVYGSDWESNANGVTGSGRIYVHSGADGRRLHRLEGSAAGDGFGIGTAEAGDVDGDGCDDLLVGAWQNDEGASGAGKCTLYSGRDGRVLATYTCANPGDTFGFDTTGMGDLDGDGALDFLVTSAWSAYNGPQSGRAFVVSGRLPERER